MTGLGKSQVGKVGLGPSWVKWDGGLNMHCERCGDQFRLPAAAYPMISVGMALAMVKAYGREHGRCRARKEVGGRE